MKSGKIFARLLGHPRYRQRRARDSHHLRGALQDRLERVLWHVHQAARESLRSHVDAPLADFRAPERRVISGEISLCSTKLALHFDGVASGGGHRGMFRSEEVATQVGTLLLVPQIVDAVSVPVISAGGIADGRGIAAAFMLGSSAVQIGMAYLFCPESTIADPHRRALATATANDTVLTNVFTGRPARNILNRAVREFGPLSTPAFPLAGGALAPLRAATEPSGSDEFMSLWSGQSAGLCQAIIQEGP